MNRPPVPKACLLCLVILPIWAGCYEAVEVARAIETDKVDTTAPEETDTSPAADTETGDTETIPGQEDLPADCRLVETGHFLGIWGIGDDTVYAVGGYESGDKKNVVQLRGDQWTTLVPKIPLSTATAVWGGAPDFIWIVGQATLVGVAVVHDGTNLDLTRAPLIPVGPLWDIWGSGLEDVWTVGASTLVHYDGETWTLADFNAFPYVFKGVWGSSGADVYVVGSPALEFPNMPQATLLRYDGEGWRKLDTGLEVEAKLLGVGGSGPNNVYVTGEQGTLLHYDGGSWSRVDMGADLSGYSLRSVWVSEDGTAYVVGNNEVDRAGIIASYRDGSWRIWDGISSLAFYDVWARPSQEVFVAGDAGVFRCSGL